VSIRKNKPQGTFFILYNTLIMSGLIRYFRESFDELKYNVTWPTWTELYQTAVVVIVASICIGLLIAGIDVVWTFLFRILYAL
jgi:preprotein translocase subunit SecE